MRRRSLSIIALSILAIAAAAAQTPGARPWYAERLEKLGFVVFEEPTASPDIEVEALAGGRAKLSDQKGRVVLLNFWATWCPPCRAEMPSIQKLHEKTQGMAFHVMAVSVGETKATVANFAKSNKYTMPMYRDTDGVPSALYGANSIPTTFIVDKKGKAIAFVVGGRDYASKEALALFSELAARD